MRAARFLSAARLFLSSRNTGIEESNVQDLHIAGPELYKPVDQRLFLTAFLLYLHPKNNEIERSFFSVYSSRVTHNPSDTVISAFREFPGESDYRRHRMEVDKWQWTTRLATASPLSR
jgi:hypothetical protein